MKTKAHSILHVINTLSVGGAELLLKHTIALLPEFSHTVVYLSGPEHLKKDFEQAGADLICLHHQHKFQVPVTVLKLRRLIAELQPLLVHSHLYEATIITRLATPASVPLACTIHSLYSQDAFKNSRRNLMLSRMTLRKRHTLITVSEEVLKDYLQVVPFEGKKFVHHNFLPAEAFRFRNRKNVGGKIRLVAVGNLKDAKNYHYLLSVLRKLEGVSLDIFGDGPLRAELEQYVRQENLDVRFRGLSNNIREELPDYDYFIQASSHEGFGLSVIEAMAAGIPVILSDIPVFREVTGGHARFFPLHNATSAAARINEVLAGSYPHQQAVQGFHYVKQRYSEEHFRNRLISIYQDMTRTVLQASELQPLELVA